MRKCPSCGIPTIDASTRLIKDTCGHTKCRLCLLQEESGCTICNAQNLQQTAPSIAAIGSFDYPQPSMTMPTHANLNSPTKIFTNILPQVFECLDNLSDAEFLINNIDNKSCRESQDSTKDQYYEENKRKTFIEDKLNGTVNNCNLNRPIINNINNENIYREDEKIQNEESNENSEAQTKSIDSLVVNTINGKVASYQSDITIVLLINGESPTSNENTVQITEINENEKDNNNLLCKTPNQSLIYKSPEFRMSDYLVFNKQGESIDVNQFIASPAQSLSSKSPEFRVSDYLSFNRQGGKVYAQLIASPAHSTGHKSPEFRPSDYLIFRNQAKKPTYAAKLIANSNESLDARVLVAGSSSTVQQIESNGNESAAAGDNKDDEDKENKVDSFEEKQCREKDVEADDGVIVATDGNHVKQNKRKKENLPAKSKKTKKSNAPLKSPRKSTRKRKLKAVTKVVEVDEKITKKKPVSSERRKRNTDWSHIVKLPGSPTSYECTKCKRSFRNFQNKNYHVACILGESPFCCEICGKTFKKRSHFEYHETTHTGNKPFKCQDCQKGFATKSKLDRHMLSHKPQNEFECDECGKRLSTKDNLKSHLALHRNPSFKCKHCPKTFTIKVNRKRHEKYCFPNNTRYTCDVCTKVFRKDYLLGQHKRRLHQKSKSYNCQICQRVFLSKSEVNRHMTIHSDLKAFCCELCDIRFRRKDNLKRHEKNHHAGPYAEEYGKVSTPISVKDDIIETTSPAAKSNSRKRQATEDSSTSSPRPKRTPKKIKNVNSPSRLKAAASPRGDVSNAVPVIRGPINIKFPDSSSNSVTKKLTEPLSLQAALVLNQQIEQQMHAQNSFCNFPGLSRGNNSPISSTSARRRMDNSNSNLISSDGVSQQPSNESQDGSKLKSKEEEFSMQHWRRRTAECLKLKYKSFS